MCIQRRADFLFFCRASSSSARRRRRRAFSSPDSEWVISKQEGEGGRSGIVVGSVAKTRVNLSSTSASI